MDFPPRAQAIIDALYAKNRDLAVGSGDEQRRLTRMIAEQIAYELGPQWGVKAASPTRPQGPSEIAYNAPPLYIWRWSDGDGHVTGVIGAPLHPPLLQPLDQTVGQFFIQVDPIDHLGVSAQIPARRPPDPAPTPTPAPPVPRGPDPDLLVLTDRVLALDHHVAELQQDVERLQSRRYIAKFWGITLVSTPEP